MYMYAYITGVNWEHWVPIGVPTWVLQKTSFIKVIDDIDKDD